VRLSLTCKEPESARRLPALRRVLGPEDPSLAGGADAEGRSRDRHLFGCLIAAAAGAPRRAAPPLRFTPPPRCYPAARSPKAPKAA
jgi:hypothetical protein